MELRLNSEYNKDSWRFIANEQSEGSVGMENCQEKTAKLQGCIFLLNQQEDYC